MRVCPHCGGKRFIATGHVVQEWILDECGLCIEVKDDCICVTHEPDDQDLWQCYECGYEAAGKEFYVDEIQIEPR